MSLTRKSCLFLEQDNEEVPQWIYSCQCDKARSDLYDATGRSIRMTHEGTWTVDCAVFLKALVCFTAISFWTNFELHTRSYDCGGSRPPGKEGARLTMSVEFWGGALITKKLGGGLSPGSATVWGYSSLRGKLFF